MKNERFGLVRMGYRNNYCSRFIRRRRRTKDNEFRDKLTCYWGNDVRDAIEKRTLPDYDYAYTELGLVYHLGNEVDGELERDYAYVEDGKLPTHFPHGRKIPQRFHKELAAYQKRVKTLV